LNKTQIASILGALSLVFFTFVINASFASKADCIGIVDKVIEEHENRDFKFQELVNERLQSIQQDVREIRARQK